MRIIINQILSTLKYIITIFLKKKNFLFTVLIQLFCNVYIKFIYVVSKIESINIYFPIFIGLLAINLFFFGLGYKFLFFTWLLYSIIIFVLTRPFLYFSVYRKESEKDPLLEFLQKNSTCSTFGLYLLAKKKIRMI